MTQVQSEPITNKQTMYRMLARGDFGNTIPQYFSIDTWERSQDYQRIPMWGVRTMVPGGPCRLYCPRDEVRTTAEQPEFRAAGINISMMIDAVTQVTLWGEVYDAPYGLVVYGIENPEPGDSWRKRMPHEGRHWEGTAARLLLRRKLNPNSLDDLEILRDRWPGHVYEFSAVEGCFGTVPGRNTIIWEVRAY